MSVFCHCFSLAPNLCVDQELRIGINEEGSYFLKLIASFLLAYNILRYPTPSHHTSSIVWCQQWLQLSRHLHAPWSSKDFKTGSRARDALDSKPQARWGVAIPCHLLPPSEQLRYCNCSVASRDLFSNISQKFCSHSFFRHSVLLPQPLICPPRLCSSWSERK